MKHFTKKIPGHDCIRHPCGQNGCGKHPGASHGISGEDWIYAVSDGKVALSLRVMSDVYPESVPEKARPDFGPRGAVLHEHHAFPVSKQQVLSEPEKCEYLSAGTCYSSDGSCIAADEFFGKYGTSRFEQPESFWQQLEQKLQSRAAQLQEERVDEKFSKCDHCKGTGIVAL